MIANRPLPAGPLAIDPTADFKAWSHDDDEPEDYRVSNGVMRIRIWGALSNECWWGASYLSIQSDLAAAREIRGLKRVVLDIDSPGGAVTGVTETVAAIQAAAAVVPVEAYVRGTCASAAFWLASACTRIVAAHTARVGCVGAVVSFIDPSGMYEKDGAVFYRFTSGRTPNKAPEPGTEAFSSETQRMVDAAGDQFLGELQRMRGPGGTLDDVAAYYQSGAMLPAADALAAGWVDAVVSPSSGGRDAWLLTGEAPPVDDDAKAPDPYRFPQVRPRAVTTEEAPMGKENGGGVVTLTVEAHAELERKLQAFGDDWAAADAKAAALAAEVSNLKTQLASANAGKSADQIRLDALESKLAEREKLDAAREVDRLIAAARERGAIDAAGEAKFRGIAAKYGADVLAESLSAIRDESAVPRTVLTSGKQMPDAVRKLTNAEMAAEAMSRSAKNGTTYKAELRKVRSEQEGGK